MAFRLIVEHYRTSNKLASFIDLFNLKDSVNHISLGLYLLLLLGQTVWYILMAVWLDDIVPSEFGVRRDPWYCCTGYKRKPTQEEKVYTREGYFELTRLLMYVVS